MEADIPAHHLYYFFNEITKSLFDCSVNGLRIWVMRWNSLIKGLQIL
jgi:hypothetical protein